MNEKEIEQQLDDQEDFEQLVHGISEVIEKFKDTRADIVMTALGQTCARYALHMGVRRKPFVKGMGTYYTVVTRMLKLVKK